MENVVAILPGGKRKIATLIHSPSETRSHDPLIMEPTPYPLGHGRRCNMLVLFGIKLTHIGSRDSIHSEHGEH